MLQLLKKNQNPKKQWDKIRNKFPQLYTSNCTHCALYLCKLCTQTHLSKFIFGLGLDPKSRDVRVCEAGWVLQLFHPTDLRHGLVLLLLLLLRLRGWHLDFMLLVWRDTVQKKKNRKVNTKIVTMQEGGRVYLPVSSLTQEGVGDELRDLVPRAAHLREVRELSIQHPLELKAEHTRIWIMGSVSRKKA